ncbi:hypothetical protein TONV_049 [Tipula oleracea nudivirus]|uniref:Uncharacterized protein n=1 Tax=Tipula oleracea nudivirus TaxID=1546257 RepID=A0A0B4VFP1_9VIRU|nr:hypothetical protein TONV_049 [Tipula oleracea nudivirus]AJD20109.1 hypothetical protein TONV_049 [Tipula oleracea nudivirus]
MNSDFKKRKSEDNDKYKKKGADLIDKRTKLYDFNKIKDLDDISELPKKFINKKNKTKTYYTFIGLNKCKFTFEYREPSALIHSYILNIINSTWYFHDNSPIFLKRSSTCTLSGTTSNDNDDYYKNFYLLMHMIHTICVYNKVYKTPKKFKVLNFELISNEMVLFCDDNTMVLFNEPLIRKYLELSTKINVKLDQQLGDNQYIKKLDTLNYRYNLLNRESSNILLKLLCIADHAATHLIDQHTSDTDFIFHKHYGSVGFTLHSVIRIIPQRKNKLLNNIFNNQFNDDGPSNLYKEQISSIFNNSDILL